MSGSKNHRIIDLTNLSDALTAQKGDIVRKPGGYCFLVIRRLAGKSVVIGRPTDVYGCDGDREDSGIELTAYAV